MALEGVRMWVLGLVPVRGWSVKAAAGASAEASRILSRVAMAEESWIAGATGAGLE